MASTKNNFLNAKPVSKLGGKSGGVRKPNKPYNKPPAAKDATPKVKPKASKPTPKPVAPTVKGPVPRPGLQNRGGITAKDLLPNSDRRGGNLPKAGAQALRSRTQGPKAPAAAKAPQVITKPVTRTGPVKGPVPPKGNSAVSMPNSRRAGVNLPKTGAQVERSTTQGPTLKGKTSGAASVVRGAASAKPNALARNLKFGRTNVAAMVLGAANLADDSRLTPEQLKKKYEVVDPNRGQRIADNLLGRNQKPKPKQGNAQSRFAGAREANLNRINNDPRFAAPTEKPKPPAPARPKPPAASAPPARPSASRPSQSTPSRTTATSSGSQQVRPAEKKPSMGREAFDRAGKGSLGPNYGIDQFGDKNGIDMERRRSFLDAKDSQEGRKAISKLMEERRKKQRENDSTSK